MDSLRAVAPTTLPTRCRCGLNNKTLELPPVGGITLDLVKCYNLVRRHFSSKVLDAFNCPPNIVARWQHAMTRFQRFWEIEQNVSLPMPTTTGIAEGDPVAVLIMVLIGATWIFQVAPDPLITRMSAYADNWSWGSTDPASHEPIALATSEVCQVAGLQVDMTKTWKWSTDPAMDQAVHQASKQLSPQGIACQTLAHAKDLSLEMRYAGPPALTTIQDRFTEGSTRLARVQASKWPLDIRRHLVKASVSQQHSMELRWSSSQIP